MFDKSVSSSVPSPQINPAACSASEAETSQAVTEGCDEAGVTCAKTGVAEAVRDRRFDPSKVAATDVMRELLQRVSSLLEAVEKRKRKRQTGALQLHTKALEALVCDLVHRELSAPSGAIMVPLAKSALSSKARPAYFMTEAFADRVKELANPALHIAVIDKGSRSLLGGVQSTLRAGAWLKGEIARLVLDFSDVGRDPELLPDPLILKSKKVQGVAKSLPLPVTPEVQRMRDEMRSINAWLAGADIEWCGRTAGVDSGQRHLRRVFNDGSMEKGGRMFHGFWQEVPKADRFTGLFIDGHAVVSLDFASMSIRLTYSTIGETPPEGDLYQVFGVGGSREGVKRVLNALLCSDELPTRFPRGTRRYFPANLKFADVYQEICKRHPRLVPLFGTGQSLIHQNIESSVMVRALLRLQEVGVVALPIHDCLLAPETCVDICKQVLEETFFEVTGAVGVVDVTRE